MSASGSTQTAVHLQPGDFTRYDWADHKYGVSREIWRPGDADGKPGPEDRNLQRDHTGVQDGWRFYQSTASDANSITEPPKYVLLDDSALYDIIRANRTNRAERGRYWPLDFTKHGDVRIDRAHRGRGVFFAPNDPRRNANRSGARQILVGPKDSVPYDLTGERGYRAIMYSHAIEPSEIEDRPWALRPRRLTAEGKRKASPERPGSSKRTSLEINTDVPRTPTHAPYTPTRRGSAFPPSSLSRWNSNRRPARRPSITATGSPIAGPSTGRGRDAPSPELPSPVFRQTEFGARGQDESPLFVPPESPSRLGLPGSSSSRPSGMNPFSHLPADQQLTSALRRIKQQQEEIDQQRDELERMRRQIREDSERIQHLNIQIRDLQESAGAPQSYKESRDRGDQKRRRDFFRR